VVNDLHLGLIDAAKCCVSQYNATKSVDSLEKRSGILKKLEKA
jgi:hypothetical protein